MNEHAAVSAAVPAIRDRVQTEFRAADLRLLGGMFSSPLTRASRNDVLAARPRSAPVRDRAVNRLDKVHRMECQFTKGIAYFLDSSNPMVRVERIRAWLKALGAAELADDLNEIEVSAEAEIPGGRRIDLLLEWTDSSSNRDEHPLHALDHDWDA